MGTFVTGDRTTETRRAIRRLTSQIIFENYSNGKKATFPLPVSSSGIEVTWTYSRFGSVNIKCDLI